MEARSLMLLLLLAQLLRLGSAEVRDWTPLLRNYAGERNAAYRWGISPLPETPNLRPDTFKVWIDGRREERYPPYRSFAAVSAEVMAESFWGKRVRFKALVGRYEVKSYRGQFAALFVRVQDSQGRMIAMDNMTQRRIVTRDSDSHIPYYEKSYKVVMDVPGPPGYDGESCPADRSGLPALIQFGFLLANGGGTAIATLQEATFEPVTLLEEPSLTQGIYVRTEGPPWNDPLS